MSKRIAQKIITVSLTEQFIAVIDKWTLEGYITSRSEFIRTAITNEFVRIGRLHEAIEEELTESVKIQHSTPMISTEGKALQPKLGEIKEERGRVWEFREHGWTSIGMLREVIK